MYHNESWKDCNTCFTLKMRFWQTNWENGNTISMPLYALQTLHQKFAVGSKEWIAWPWVLVMWKVCNKRKVSCGIKSFGSWSCCGLRVSDRVLSLRSLSFYLKLGKRAKGFVYILVSNDQMMSKLLSLRSLLSFYLKLGKWAKENTSFWNLETPFVLHSPSYWISIDICICSFLFLINYYSGEHQ